MNITIKNVPARLHRLLKNRAHDSGRSINQEVIACLSDKLEPKPVDIDGTLQRAELLRRATVSKVSVSQMQRDLEAA